MALNFPDSPNNGDTHQGFTYNSAKSKWSKVGGSGGSSVTVSDSAPSSPNDGDMWYNSLDLNLYVYYNDGSSNQWVQSAPQQVGADGADGATGPQGPAGSDGTSGGAGVATIYTNMAALIAATGMSSGDQALVTANNNLYIYNGSGWYKIATVNNQSPSTITGVDGTYALAIDGSPTTITAVSTDPEGFPLTWSYSTTGLGSIATVSNTDGVFTITPSTVEANAGTFTLTISATDGINGAVSATSNITLEFIVIVTNSKYTISLVTAPNFNAVPYSFSDISYQDKNFSFSSQGSMGAVQFNATGTKMYGADYGNDILYKNSLNQAWDISTASYDNVSLAADAYTSAYYGLWFKPDGSEMYAADLSLIHI